MASTIKATIVDKSEISKKCKGTPKAVKDNENYVRKFLKPRYKEIVDKKKKKFIHTQVNDSSYYSSVTSATQKQPENIFHVSKVNGKLTYWMKWQGIEGAEIISREDAVGKYTQHVIKFYEDRLEWTDTGPIHHVD